MRSTGPGALRLALLFAATVVALMALAACGQKGDLYLPEPEAALTSSRLGGL